MVPCAPGASCSPQLLLCAKSTPETRMMAMGSGAVPSLVKVTVCGCVRVPTATAPKSTCRGSAFKSFTEVCASAEKEYLPAARINKAQPKTRSGKCFLAWEVVIICCVYSSGGLANAYSQWSSKLKYLDF